MEFFVSQPCTPARSTAIEELSIARPKLLQYHQSILRTALNTEEGYSYVSGKFMSDTLYEYLIRKDLKINKYVLPFPNEKYEYNICKYANKKRLVLYENGALYLVTKDSSHLITDLNKSKEFTTDGLQVQIRSVTGNIFYHDNLVYFPIEATFTKDGTKYGGKYYNYPMTASYDFTTKEIKYIGMLYPKSYTKKNYSALEEIYQTYHTDRIIYSASFSAEIYEFNLEKDTLLKFNMPSCYQKENIPEFQFKGKKIDKKDSVDAYIRHTHRYLTKLNFDGEFYFRTFTPRMAYKNSEGLFNTYQDRRVVFVCYDKDHNYSFNQLLPKGVYYNDFTFRMNNIFYLNYHNIQHGYNSYDFYKIAFND